LETNFLVTQSNGLIEARQKKPLSAREQKIILTMVSMIQPSDDDFIFYEISIREFHEMLGLESREHYTQIKEIVENLMSKVIEIPQANGDWLMTHWVSTAQYIKGEGAIRLKFVPELKPYLLQLKNQFTSYRLSNVLSLKSVYSIRLYELMKRWQHLGRWTCLVEDLREKLGATTKTYNLYGNLKNKILIAATNEINEKTDLHITFKEIKKGRKVDKIEFSIQHFKEKEIRLPEKPKKELQTSSTNEVSERLNDLANGFCFDKAYFADIYATALTIWQEQAEYELGLLVKYVNNDSTVSNPLGFIKAKLKLALQQHELGDKISFNELQKGSRSTVRKSILPEWFHDRKKAREETVATLGTEEYSEKKRALLEKLGLSSEEIEQEMKE